VLLAFARFSFRLAAANDRPSFELRRRYQPRAKPVRLLDLIELLHQSNEDLLKDIRRFVLGKAGPPRDSKYQSLIALDKFIPRGLFAFAAPHDEASILTREL